MANPPRGRIWCVPFARAVSGVEIRGNARTWWDQARGRYARGHEPKVGAVMAFAASRSMPKGHVAVVSKVIDDRTVLVDQANWERNRITLDTVVVDVSAKGDWSKVRVANGAGSLGRVNPVKGFIYAE
ncbi:CHAP domain-containing protein [Tabrizicola sp. TH137]|nr:CHAP domain-containing protein [Tabrizicola sp. TH137]